jgi:hypothetical protein
VKTKQQNKGNGRLTEEAFVKKAIQTLRTGKSRGIHVRFSGFNEAFRKYFGVDPRESQDRLVKAGVIVVRPCKGGAMMYLAGDEPAAVEHADTALAKMGIG